jgi:TM2 domain-containing membrane protein YozV
VLSREAVEREEEALRDAIAKLPDAQRAALYRAAEKKLRDPDTYATLNYLLVSGLHHFYLGEWLRGALELGGAIAGVVLLFTEYWLIGLLALVGIAVVELYALFRSQVIVQDHNNRVLREALEQQGRPG